MPLMSMREYARHRGVGLSAVQRAVSSGRIFFAEDGKSIDSEEADSQWEQNTNPSYRAGEAALVPVEPAPEPPREKKAKGLAKGLVDGEDAGPKFIQSKAEREFFEARRAELKYLEEEGELVSVVEVNQYVGGMILTARDILLRIAPELRDKLALETDPGKCHRMVEREVHRALRAMAQYKGDGNVIEVTVQ